MIYIFDACALIALFKREQGFDKISAFLDEAHAGQSVIYMNTINLIEVYYWFYRALGKEKSALIGDAIGLATAVKMNGSFITGDHSDFGEIEKAESIPFFWFR